ncbi:MAG: serine hydrolase domain-containing protein [Haloferacaceae archaeon]
MTRRSDGGDPAPDADGVAALFDHHPDVGLHHGAQLAVYGDGDRVLSRAGGVVGPDGDAPATTPDRKHVLFSCTKPFVAVAAHRLVEDGRLAYDDPVRDHWPGFADPGTTKAGTTVGHVLSHRAGLHESPVDDDPAAWADWDRVVGVIEDMEPAFEPGATAAYHALTYGFLVGELVRRVAGQPVAAHVRERVFEPLGMADTHLALPDDCEDDVAELAGFAPFDRCRDPGVGLGTGTAEAAALFNREAIHRATVPSASATGTARDMARFYACLANGGSLDGTRLLARETVERATAVRADVERDATMGVPRRYAMGFERAGTTGDKFGSLAPPRVFGHGGLGSVVGWADPRDGLAMAYVTNGIRDEYEHVARANAMADAVRAAFG